MFRLAVRSPGGEQLPEVEFGLGSTVEYTFVYEKTRIQITDTANERNTGDQLMLIRFTAPSPGVWTFLIRGARVFPESIFDIWLAPQQFRSGELFFLVPDPDVTLTVPSYTTDAVTVTFYNSENGSFYYRSGRGFGRTGEIKPDLAAPGVEISTVNGPYGGCTYGRSLCAADAVVRCGEQLPEDFRKGNPDVSKSRCAGTDTGRIPEQKMGLRTTGHEEDI